jgi:curved DNA-binding protein CbpA
MNSSYPYSELGFATENVDDADVRRAYLDLVRRFPPEKRPDDFQRIHAAYEAIATERQRILRRYESPQPDWPDILQAFPAADRPPNLPRRALAADALDARAAEWAQRLNNQAPPP